MIAKSRGARVIGLGTVVDAVLGEFCNSQFHSSFLFSSVLHSFFFCMHVSNPNFYSEYVLGHKITLASPLDSMLSESRRFLGNVDGSVIQTFLFEMRGIKRMLFTTCVESVELIWTDYLRKVQGREGKQLKPGQAPKLTLDQAREEEAAMRVGLAAVKAEWLERPDTGTTSPIDSIYIAHQLKRLQELLPKELVKWGHELNPRDTETNLFTFCASGLRIRMIEPLSAQVFALESIMPKTEAETAVSIHGDGTTDYGQQTVDRGPKKDKSKKKKKPKTLCSITSVPQRTHGGRFIRWTKDACFSLLKLPKGELEEWKKKYPTIPGETWVQMKLRNRLSAWWKLFFDAPEIQRMEQKGYLLSSFSSDGNIPSFLHFFYS